MNTFWQKLKGVLTNKKYMAIIIIVLAVGGYFLYKKTHTATAALQYVTQPVQETTVTESVTGSGQMSNQETLDIKPQASGNITSLDIKEGQQVSAGQTL